MCCLKNDGNDKIFCELEDDKYIEEWEQFIEIFEKIDRLIDICNSHLGRGVYCINTPHYNQFFDLFSTLELFEEWKKGAGRFTFEFITRQAYEGLLWLVYGIAGVADRITRFQIFSSVMRYFKR